MFLIDEPDGDQIASYRAVVAPRPARRPRDLCRRAARTAPPGSAHASSVEAFWKWCRESCERPVLLPKSPLAKALRYARERRDGLEVFLDDPDVPIDTNHLYADTRFMPTLRPKSLTDRVAPVGLSA